MFFFFNDTATTEIYTLSLHDALPILLVVLGAFTLFQRRSQYQALAKETETLAIPTVAVMHAAVESAEEDLVLPGAMQAYVERSEEHTSELQSPCNLLCRLLLERKTSAEKKRQSSNQHQLHIDVLMHAIE